MNKNVSVSDNSNSILSVLSENPQFRVVQNYKILRKKCASQFFNFNIQAINVMHFKKKMKVAKKCKLKRAFIKSDLMILFRKSNVNGKSR